MLKILFILLIFFFVFYFLRILQMLYRAKKEMDNITIEKLRQRMKQSDPEDHSGPSDGKTYELDSKNYKIED